MAQFRVGVRADIRSGVGFSFEVRNTVSLGN